jgi:PhnB protein
VGRFKEMPKDAGMEMPASDGDKIMHISLPISTETILMGCDTGGEWASSYKQGNNYSISINADTKESAERIFNELSAGGMVTMPLGNTFWGDYFGLCTDKYGINWMMSFNENVQHQK